MRLHACKGGEMVETDDSWWEYDGNGIELCRVCPKCKREKLARYRPELLRPYSQADVDESIEGGA